MFSYNHLGYLTIEDYGVGGWFPKGLLNGDGVTWEVIEKIRNENGGIDSTAAQNLSVSYRKILGFLHEEKLKAEKTETDPYSLSMGFVLLCSARV